MDHVVYVDAKAKEMEKLISGSKTMIIRGAAGRKMPYGRVLENDILYFIRNNGEGRVLAKADVKTVYNSEKLSTLSCKPLLGKSSLFNLLSLSILSEWIFLSALRSFFSSL